MDAGKAFGSSEGAVTHGRRVEEHLFPGQWLYRARKRKTDAIASIARNGIH